MRGPGLCLPRLGSGSRGAGVALNVRIGNGDGAGVDVVGYQQVEEIMTHLTGEEASRGGVEVGPRTEESTTAVRATIQGFLRRLSRIGVVLIDNACQCVDGTPLRTLDPNI